MLGAAEHIHAIGTQLEVLILGLTLCQHREEEREELFGGAVALAADEVREDGVRREAGGMSLLFKRLLWMRYHILLHLMQAITLYDLLQVESAIYLYSIAELARIEFEILGYLSHTQKACAIERVSHSVARTNSSAGFDSSTRLSNAGCHVRTKHRDNRG